MSSRRVAFLFSTFLWLHAVHGGETFTFRVPELVRYELLSRAAQPAAVTASPVEWLAAHRVGSDRTEWFGRRILIALDDDGLLPELLQGRPLTRGASVISGFHLLEAPDAGTAVREAAALAGLPGVRLTHPVRRQRAGLHGGYAPAPTDRYYSLQWHLENLPAGGSVLGPRADINARAAWEITRGEGVLIANADDGVEETHPDLAANWFPGLQYNFHTLQSNGVHTSRIQYHGTATAGLHSAARNKLGGVGVAHGAKFTSWVIFDASDFIPDEEGMARMFLYASNSVPVQNHSWGNADFEPLIPGTVEILAVSNAATLGRQGRGVVMVRSAGNTRETDSGNRAGIGDANFDGYANDPHAITVGAVNYEGRVARYSVPGACILVGAPGGDSSGNLIFTTDRVGTAGLNRRGTIDDPNLADFTYSPAGFFGTSASAPILTGVAALVLSANPQLGYRDVQQILLFSARQTDTADPDSRPNGAGFVVNHNIGFGVPDAGVAVRLAQNWSNRPPAELRSYVDTTSGAIPDDGLRVEVTGTGVPAQLSSLPASGSDGLHPDVPTDELPLYNAGLAASPIADNLSGRAALIHRQPPVTFAEKVGNVAKAGATCAIFINHTGTTERLIPRDLYFSTIPAVLLGLNDGTALENLLASNPNLRARLKLNALNREFQVSDRMICEHVGVRVKWTHARMGDLRVTLRSPAGTMSVLHRPSLVTSAVPEEMTYWTTHHFFESSAGTWTVAVSDEASGIAGTLNEVTLFLEGVPITDTDADGLDDNWERQRLGNLSYRAADDPDGDGANNAREQILGTDPLRDETVFAVAVAKQDAGRVRLTWPASAGRSYFLEGASTADGPFQILTPVTGYYPQAGVVLDTAAASTRVLRVRR